MKTIVIIQARLTSTRFPGKMFAELKGKPLIDYCIDLERTLPFYTVFAIPDTKPNDDLYEHLIQNGCEVFRGDEENVLKRYYDCAINYDADEIIRLTGDMPLTTVNDVILQYALFKVRGKFSEGNSISCFTFAELENTYKNAHSQRDKEHIIYYMENSIDFPEDLTRLNNQ